MDDPRSTNLRSRLASNVMGGLSHRTAAERFGVSAASAVRWVQANDSTGSARPALASRRPAQALEDDEVYWGTAPGRHDRPQSLVVRPRDGRRLAAPPALPSPDRRPRFVHADRFGGAIRRRVGPGWGRDYLRDRNIWCLLLGSKPHWLGRRILGYRDRHRRLLDRNFLVGIRRFRRLTRWQRRIAFRVFFYRAHGKNTSQAFRSSESAG